MKKLLLTLGAVASVAAPVAAVVACSSDTITYGTQLDSSVKNGTNVQSAFKNHLTFGEMFNRKGTITTGLTALQTAAKAFDVALKAAGDATSIETAINNFITAIETYNGNKEVTPALTPNEGTDEDVLFKAYEGKKVEAVLFYQDAQDTEENSKGEAFYVDSTKAEDWTNAKDGDWNEMEADAKGFDQTNSGHKITPDHFGIRFDIAA